MQRTERTPPIDRRVVLVGAGNAHLLFVRRWKMRPIPGVSVTLVNDTPTIPYSAMVPGLIAGEYEPDRVTIDLVRLCPRAGVRLVADPVVRIDTANRKILFADRPAIGYDILSLGLGSIPVPPAGAEEFHWSLSLRPLGQLIHRIELLEADLQRSPRHFHLGVVGGGASGCELALALRRRFPGASAFAITLLHSGERLLANFPAAASRIMELELHRQGCEVRLNTRVTGVEPDGLILDSGKQLEVDGVLWATDPAPPAVLRESKLALDSTGFLLVDKSLQTVSDPAVFGTGDCVAFPAHPQLPRNGVMAVRQGKMLFRNISALIDNRKLQQFRPQRFWLSLLNLGHGRSLASYGPFSFKSSLARRWKERIDTRWMEKFHAPSEPIEQETEAMRCGGCGSKVPGDVLAGVVESLDVLDDARVLMGARKGEDAAVFRTSSSGTVEVQSVDYFKSFGDDPFAFGRVAAVHAVSDLYAMNAEPFSALAIATVPFARASIQREQLAELLAGAARALREMGVVLAGGHTTEGPEIALGFSVTGFAHPDQLFRKDALRPGDVLILTKPLGTGALLAAWMRGLCRARWYEEVIATMLVSNRRASQELARAGVTCCTDVTGFGLAGHLLELLDASQVCARLDVQSIPVLSGFVDVVARGVVSTLHAGNARSGCRIASVAPPPACLFDPQTSGGLLVGVSPERAADLLAALHRSGLPHAAIIGSAIERTGAEADIRIS